ncbi:alpha-L-fucosidase [Spirochaetia bacterium]|nr:alpha-L-fucosidase [Spirochaetia bacterium]GHU31027.1 alpha-L-fucosidase [Spirochaetia bacterium]
MPNIDYTNLVEGIKELDNVIANSDYKDTWDSINNFMAPKWFNDAKFGIFIHWGVFSVPAFNNEWYPRSMYIEATPEYQHHIKTYGPHKSFGYKDFIPLYTMEHFDANEWAAELKNAGAKYIVPVAEHHDGFQMYKSSISLFNAANMGPKKNLLGDLKNAIENNGLVFGASSHRAEHWFFLRHGKLFDSDIKEPLIRGDLYWPSVTPEPSFQDLHGTPTPSDEYMCDWLLRTAELIDVYKPHILYFDWWIQHAAFRPYLKKVLAYYHARADEYGFEPVICTKHDAVAFGSGIVEIERGKFADAKAFKWQTETPVAKNSWCYTSQNVYKKASDIVCELVDVVSKNGNMLLNIGPKSDGTISSEECSILRDIGAWLKTNGECIYGAKVWRTSAEGPTKESEGQFQDDEGACYTSEDFRFTCKGDSIYVISLAYPNEGMLKIKALSKSADPNKPAFHGIIKTVSILGSKEKPQWKVTDNSLEVNCKLPATGFPVVVKVQLE